MINFALIMYISSILFSLGIDVDQFLWTVKDMAKRGYKFDLNKIALKDIFASKKGILNWEYLIPGFNIWRAYERNVDYYENNDKIIDSFIESDVVYEMKRRDKQKFRKNPSKFKAFKLITKDISELPSLQCVYINNDDFCGEIYYQEKHGEIIISRVTGNLKGFSEDKLRSILITAILERDFGKEVVETFPEHEDIYADKEEPIVYPVPDIDENLNQKNIILSRNKKN